MIRRAALACLAAALPWGVAAEEEMPEGDPDYGEYLSGECVTCHRADGADEGIPSITGWDAEAFYLTLVAYRSGDREHEAMRMVTSRLSNEEIAGLAAYFGGLK